MTAPLTPAAAEVAEATDRAAVVAALVAESGAVTRAAKRLGCAPETLRKRILAYGLRAWLTATYPRSARQPARGQKKSDGTPLTVATR